MLKKLRLKFVLINMSIVTIMLCVILGLVFYFTSANLEAASINMMQNIAANPLHLGVPNEREKDIRLPYFTIQLGLRGERIAAGGGYYDLSDTDFLDDLVNAVFSSPKQLGIIEEYNLRYYRSDMPLNHCLVFADISSERATLNALLGTCGFIGALSFLVFLGISILLSRWAVRPVETAWMQQRQFVADASHELKTPLTVIITNTELAQSNECSESVRRTSLNNIAAVSRQMRNLIEQMLELARADNARGKELSGKVELGKLILNALLTFEPVFFERGRMLEQRVIEDIHVQGSAEQLRQIVDILLDNAQKYSRESGKTWVSLQKNGKKRCLLTVENEGEPLSPQEARDNTYCADDVYFAQIGGEMLPLDTERVQSYLDSIPSSLSQFGQWLECHFFSSLYKYADFAVFQRNSLCRPTGAWRKGALPLFQRNSVQQADRR